MQVNACAKSAAVVFTIAVLFACNSDRDRSAAVTKNAPDTAAVRAAPPLEYTEYVTGNASRDEVLPLIVAVHGLGDRPGNFSALFANVGFPARFVFPRGPVEYGPGYMWFPIGKDREALARAIDDAGDRVAALAAKLAKEKPTRGRPIITGFSQGGMISFAIAAGHPCAFAAAFPVAGVLVESGEEPAKAADAKISCDGVEPVEVTAFHGDMDDRIDVEGAVKSVKMLAERGYDAELRRYQEVPHTVSHRMRKDWFNLIEVALRRNADFR